MTPQVAERLLYESEAALRLVDSLLAELEETGSADHVDVREPDAQYAAPLPERILSTDLSELRDDLAALRRTLERRAVNATTPLPEDDGLGTAISAIRHAEERIDTLARRTELIGTQER